MNSKLNELKHISNLIIQSNQKKLSITIPPINLLNINSVNYLVIQFPFLFKTEKSLLQTDTKN